MNGNKTIAANFNATIEIVSNPSGQNRFWEREYRGNLYLLNRLVCWVLNLGHAVQNRFDSGR